MVSLRSGGRKISDQRGPRETILEERDGEEVGEERFVLFTWAHSMA